MATGKYQEWLEPDGLLRLEAWARDGLTDVDIAKKMDIGYSTLQAWKTKYQDIQDSLKRGKDVVDIEIENALHKRAIGYEYDEVTQEFSPETGGMVITKIVTKQVVPDTTAQIFWLKNRKPERWRDKQNIEHNGSIDVRKIYEDMSEEELTELARKYERISGP